MYVTARTEEETIWGWERIRKSLPGPPPGTTFRRWRKQGFLDWIQVGSMSNTGGGYGWAAHTLPSSLAAAWDKWVQAHTAHVSEVHRQAVAKRWHTDTSSGSVI